jgi:hypothetical protein
MELAPKNPAIFLLNSDLISYRPKTCTVYIFRSGFYSYE